MPAGTALLICARGRSALREYRRHGVTDQDQPSRTCQTVIGRWSTCRRRSEGGRQSHKRCRHQTESAPPRRHAQESHRVARPASRLRNIARSLPSSRRERRPRRELHPHNDGKEPFWETRFPAPPSRDDARCLRNPELTATRSPHGRSYLRGDGSQAASLRSTLWYRFRSFPVPLCSASGALLRTNEGARC